MDTVDSGKDSSDRTVTRDCDCDVSRGGVRGSLAVTVAKVRHCGGPLGVCMQLGP